MDAKRLKPPHLYISIKEMYPFEEAHIILRFQLVARMGSSPQGVCLDLRCIFVFTL